MKCPKCEKIIYQLPCTFCGFEEKSLSGTLFDY